MQFHLDGFRPGDPAVSEARHPEPAGSSQPADVDVLIVGCGPAGLTLAAQLSAFPEITTRIVDQKPGPLALGQADGIACRTIEMFQAFGFAERVLKESYWVNEVTFWKPDEAKPERIVRHGRVQDVEDGLSEMPHVILNQARVHDFFLDVMKNAPNRLVPDYQRRLVGLEVDAASAESDPQGAYPVKVQFERLDPAHQGETETINARYVVGCDGARSAVRKILGRELRGDSANQAWGVMDVLAVTDFPDVRLKSIIQSAAEGSILIIPREGGYLFRIYVELDKLKQNERVSARNLTVEHLIGAAQRILHPYTLDVREVAWWSVYEIGQRLCDKFDDVPEDDIDRRTPRVFIAGDACHTHSPKAGQGMNVSMQDSFNLGWKLASVLQGRSAPSLLHSYSAERQAIAHELIEFDREWAKMLSAPPAAPGRAGPGPKEVESYFVRHGHYTAGTATRYAPSALVGQPTYQDLARGFLVGTRFHSFPVIRLADARRIELGHLSPADGRWRLISFADRAGSRLNGLCAFLEQAPDSPLHSFTPRGKSIDSVIDLRAVLQTAHRDTDIGAMPTLLLPRKGRLGLVDYEKVFCPAPTASGDIFDARGIDREQGCLIVVRPDQYIAQVLPLDGHAALREFFARILLPQA